MAISLLVYSSRDSSIGAEALVAELDPTGWAAAVPQTYVWIGGVREARTLLDGVVYGWRASDDQDDRIRDLVAQLSDASTRKSATASLAQLADVVACEARGAPFEFEPGELEENDELSSDMRARLAMTRTQYVTRINASQSELAARFHEAVWRAIVAATDGIGLDPQAGEWT